MSHPHATNSWRGDTDADQLELIGDADVALRGELGRHLEDLLLELRRGMVGYAKPPALLRIKTFGAMLLVGFFDLVEVAAADGRGPPAMR